MSRRYEVTITNETGCSLGDAGLSWSVEVVADSEEEAVAAALPQALALNRRGGLSFLGVSFDEAFLRSLVRATGIDRPEGRACE